MKTIFDKTDLNSILERIGHLTPESKPLWGTMTANQMICHLSDPMRDMLGERQTEPVTPPEMWPGIQAIVLTENDWDHNLPTFPPYSQDEGGGGTQPLSFEIDNETLVQLIKKIHSSPSMTAFQPHAGLGPLNLSHGGEYIWKHADHHLRQFGV